jgi:hypothetical protein
VASLHQHGSEHIYFIIFSAKVVTAENVTNVIINKFERMNLRVALRSLLMGIFVIEWRKKRKCSDGAKGNIEASTFNEICVGS